MPVVVLPAASVTVSAPHGQDVAAAHGSHNSDTIRRCGSRIASGSVSFDSIHSRSTGDRAPGINRNTRSGGSASPNTGTARARDRGGCDSRRSTTRVGGRDARGSSFDRSGSGDTEVASRGAVEFRKDAGLSPVTAAVVILIALTGSRISVPLLSPTVDGDTGVGIDARAIVGAGSGDMPIALSPEPPMMILPPVLPVAGLDAVPFSGCSDSMYRDVAACRVAKILRLFR